MGASITLNLFGSGIAISSIDRTIVERVKDRFDRYVCAEKLSACREFLIEPEGVGYRVISAGRSCHLAFSGLWPDLDDLLLLELVRSRPHLHFVHASSVVIEDQVAVFVGASTCGKSTLAWSLDQRGWLKNSDDVTPIDLNRGLAFPFHTPMTLRPFTANMVVERQNSAEIAPTSDINIAFPVKWLFFLDTTPGSHLNPLPVSTNLEEWDKMFQLVCGQPPRDMERRTISIEQRDHRDFNRAPTIRSAGAAMALKQFMRHSYPLSPSFASLLPQLSILFGSVKCFHLTPGHLSATVDLVEKTCLN